MLNTKIAIRQDNRWRKFVGPFVVVVFFVSICCEDIEKLPPIEKKAMPRTCISLCAFIEARARSLGQPRVMPTC